MQAVWVLEALEHVGVGSFHVVLNVLVGAFLVCCGGEVLLVTGITGAMEGTWDVPPMVRGAVVSLLMVGNMIGSLVGGPVSDSIGRRPTWLFCVAMISLFGALSSFATGPAAFLACHFCVCAAWGAGVPACVALVAETASAGMRATLENSIWLGFVAGEVYISSLMLAFGVGASPAAAGVQAGAWDKVALWAAFPSAAAFAVSFFFLAESPHFLEAVGRRREAIEILQRMAKRNGGGELGLDCPQTRDCDEGDACEESRQAAPMKLCDGQCLTLSDRLRIMFSPGLRSTMCGVIYHFFLANFLLFGLIYALPQVFAQLDGQVHVGLSPMGQTLVASLSESAGIAAVALVIYGKTVEHQDSLRLMAVVGAGLQACMVPTASGAQALWVVLPAMYLSKAPAVALYNLVFIYVNDAFPTECRCTALAFCNIVGHSGAALAPAAFEALNGTTGPAGFFGLNVCLCAGGAVVAKLLLNPMGEGAPASHCGTLHQHLLRC